MSTIQECVLLFNTLSLTERQYNALYVDNQCCLTRLINRIIFLICGLRGYCLGEAQHALSIQEEQQTMHSYALAKEALSVAQSATQANIDHFVQAYLNRKKQLFAFIDPSLLPEALRNDLETIHVAEEIILQIQKKTNKKANESFEGERAPDSEPKPPTLGLPNAITTSTQNNTSSEQEKRPFTRQSISSNEPELLHTTTVSEQEKRPFTRQSISSNEPIGLNPSDIDYFCSTDPVLGSIRFGSLFQTEYPLSVLSDRIQFIISFFSKSRSSTIYDTKEIKDFARLILFHLFKQTAAKYITDYQEWLKIGNDSVARARKRRLYEGTYRIILSKKEANTEIDEVAKAVLLLQKPTTEHDLPDALINKILYTNRGSAIGDYPPLIMFDAEISKVRELANRLPIDTMIPLSQEESHAFRLLADQRYPRGGNFIPDIMSDSICRLRRVWNSLATEPLLSTADLATVKFLIENFNLQK